MSGYTDQTGLDLIYRFKSLTSTKADDVGYKYKGTNNDLSNYFEKKPTGGITTSYCGYSSNGTSLNDIFENTIFNFIVGDTTNYTISTLSGGYTCMRFKIGTFQFYPTTSIKLYQLFVVGGGASGSKGALYSKGGKGGSVACYPPQYLGVGYNPITVSSSNIFTITVNSGESNNTTACTGFPELNLTGVAGAGADGGSNGTQNIYTNLYYGGGGGNTIAGYNAQNGGLGGGGGAGGNGGFLYGGPGGSGGGADGLIGGLGSGGSGGSGDDYTNGISAKDGNNGGDGGGAGGTAGSTGASGVNGGGGGGGAGYYGGGGGAGGFAYSSDGDKYRGGGYGGGGGTGTVLLIFK